MRASLGIGSLVALLLAGLAGATAASAPAQAQAQAQATQPQTHAAVALRQQTAAAGGATTMAEPRSRRCDECEQQLLSTEEAQRALEAHAEGIADFEAAAAAAAAGARGAAS